MKVARVRISRQILESLLRAEFPTKNISTNAPKDLKVLGISHDDICVPPVSLYVWCESETFDDVPEGCVPPTIEPFTYEVKNG